jgi:hypothetical protein
MNEPAAAGTAAVRVEHHMFYLAEPGQVAAAPPPVDAVNGLVVSRPGMAVVITGASGGLVTLSVQVRRSPPERVLTHGWDEVVDHSMLAKTGALHVVPLMHAPPDLPLLTPSGPGPYRLRVHARGRDTQPDAVALEPAEEYLITIWPAPTQPDEIHLRTDRYGASRRRSAAAAPPQPETPPSHDPHEQQLRDKLRRVRGRHPKPPRH